MSETRTELEYKLKSLQELRKAAHDRHLQAKKHTLNVEDLSRRRKAGGNAKAKKAAEAAEVETSAAYEILTKDVRNVEVQLQELDEELLLISLQPNGQNKPETLLRSASPGLMKALSNEVESSRMRSVSPKAIDGVSDENGGDFMDVDKPGYVEIGEEELNLADESDADDLQKHLHKHKGAEGKKRKVDTESETDTSVKPVKPFKIVESDESNDNEDRNEDSDDDEDDGKEKDILKAVKARNERNAGLAALQQWKSKSSRVPLSDELKNKIRTVQSFLPEAAIVSRKLALEVLTTNRGNIICVYHTLKDRATKKVDGADVGNYQIHGVAQGRKSKKKKNDVMVCAEGILHCGCSEENALFGFIFWKTWRVTALIENTLITEGFEEDVLKPRDRLFAITAWKKATGLTLDDLYCGKVYFDVDAYEKGLVLKSIKALISQYNKMDHGLDFIPLAV